VTLDGDSCMLEILDTADQEEYTALRDQWIRDGQGFVLVYSVCSRSSFTRIRKYHRQVSKVKESVISEFFNLPYVPMMLVGNECDRNTDREVSTQEGHALSRELGCEFVEASAKNCFNVEKAFCDVVRLIRRQRR
jgi:GTPase KRas